MTLLSPLSSLVLNYLNMEKEFILFSVIQTKWIESHTVCESSIKATLENDDAAWIQLTLIYSFTVTDTLLTSSSIPQTEMQFEAMKSQ